MSSLKKAKKQIIKNLNIIFEKAIANENLTAAIQSQNTLTKIYFAETKDLKDLTLEDLSEDQIKNLIKQSENKLK